jgi:hypothetical protein
MTMNRLELRMKYKAETAQSAEPVTAYARMGKFGDVIVDQYEIDERLIAQLPHDNRQRVLRFPILIIWNGLKKN